MQGDSPKSRVAVFAVVLSAGPVHGTPPSAACAIILANVKKSFTARTPGVTEAGPIQFLPLHRSQSPALPSHWMDDQATLEATSGRQMLEELAQSHTRFFRH